MYWETKGVNLQNLWVQFLARGKPGVEVRDDDSAAAAAGGGGGGAGGQVGDGDDSLMYTEHSVPLGAPQV